MFALWFRKCWTFLDRKHDLFIFTFFNVSVRLVFSVQTLTFVWTEQNRRRLDSKGSSPSQSRSSSRAPSRSGSRYWFEVFWNVTSGIQMPLLQQGFTCSLLISCSQCASEVMFEGKTNPWFLLSPLFRMFPSWRPLCLRCGSSSCAAALWCCVCKRTSPGNARWPSACSPCGSSALRRRSTGWSSTPRPNRQWVSTNKPLGV